MLIRIVSSSGFNEFLAGKFIEIVSRTKSLSFQYFAKTHPFDQKKFEVVFQITHI
jgi:hypothetical protein